MRRSDGGQVVVESALAMAAFVMLVIGVLDFGRAFFAWQTLSVVAREGARWGMVHGSESGLSKDQAETQGAGWMQSQFGTSLPPQAKVKFTWPDGSNEPGNTVRVSVEADYTPVTPLLGTKKVKLEGVSQMEIIF